MTNTLKINVDFLHANAARISLPLLRKSFLFPFFPSSSCFSVVCVSTTFGSCPVRLPLVSTLDRPGLSRVLHVLTPDRFHEAFGRIVVLSLTCPIVRHPCSACLATILVPSALLIFIYQQFAKIRLHSGNMSCYAMKFLNASRR